MDNGWKQTLRREASLHHMCEENRTALASADSKTDAVRLYKKTIDWALEEGYPRLDTLRKYFSDCESEGVFIDRHFNNEDLRDQQVYVFHNCTGTIRVGLNVQKRIIPMLYFANDCRMTVKSSGPAALQVRVPLYIFGDNNIIAEQSEDILCKVYKFSCKNDKQIVTSEKRKR